MWKMVKQTSQKLVRKRVKTLWLCCISSKRELKIIEACFKGLYQQSNYSYHHNNPCLCSAYFFLKSDGNNIPSHFKCNDSMPISLEILTVVVLWLSPQRKRIMFPVRTWLPRLRPTVHTNIDIQWNMLPVLLLLQSLCMYAKYVLAAFQYIHAEVHKGEYTHA